MASCRCGRTASIISNGVPWCSAHALIFVGTFPFDDFERIEAGGYPLPRLARPLFEAGVAVGLQDRDVLRGAYRPSAGECEPVPVLHIVEEIA